VAFDAVHTDKIFDISEKHSVPIFRTCSALRTDAANSLVHTFPPKHIPSNLDTFFDNFNRTVAQDRSLVFWNMKNNLFLSAWVKEMKLGLLEAS